LSWYTVFMTEYKQLPFSDPRLGRHVVHDERSREFAFLGNPRKALASVRHQRHVPVWYQNVGACTLNAGLGCLGTGPFYDTTKTLWTDWTEDAAVRLYSRATEIDEFPGTYPPEDTGSSGLAAAKVLKEKGLIDSYSHAFSFEDALAALQTRPVITGINWDESFFEPDADGIIHRVPNGPSAGGHEFILDEIDVERQLIGATNSWGTSYGKNGRFYIPFDLYRQLLSEQGDVTIFNPLKAPVAPVVPVVMPQPSVPLATSDDVVLWNAIRAWTLSQRYGTPYFLAGKIKVWARAKGLS